jgi:hypothetical protein
VKKINPNLYPKDGYFFKESDGSLHRGKNWREVVAKVTEYRKLKGLTPGSVVREVMAQACQRNPNLCHEETTEPRPRTPVPLKALVLRWMFKLAQGKTPGSISLVKPEDARNRADVCAGCPFNQALGVNSCSACKQSMDAHRKIIFEGRAKFDGRLGGCKALAVDLGSFVWLDYPRVDNEALPAHCWSKITRT